MKTKQDKKIETTTEERMRILANLLIDRLLEDKRRGILSLYKNSITLKEDGEIKKII